MEDQTPTNEKVEFPEEGSVLKGTNEIVVYDRDDDGAVIGWHKEVRDVQEVIGG